MTGALCVAGGLEQKLREGRAVRVHAQRSCQRAEGRDGLEGGQEAADASQSGTKPVHY